MTLKAVADSWRHKPGAGVYAERGSAARDFQNEPLSGVKLKALKDAALALIEEIDRLEESASRLPHDGIRLYEEVARFEIHLITLALVHTGGNQRRAAQLLGVKETTLNSKVKRYRIFAAAGARTKTQ